MKTVSNVLLIKTYVSKSTKGEGVPLGLLYISACLKCNGHKVTLIDFTLPGKNDYEYLRNEIDKTNPRIVGITCNTHERFSVMEVAEYIKKNYPQILIVVGGPHITLLGEEMMKSCSAIDLAIIEDGEYAMLALANASNDFNKIKKIPGVCFRQGDLIVKNVPAEIITDLDTYGHPDLDIINMEDYSLRLQVGKGLEAISICTSRGCPYRCSFCAAG